MKFKSLLLTAFLAIFLFPVQSFACACCAEPGFYSIWTGKPDRYYLEVLEKINFAENAKLYLNAAGFDSIKGLDALTKNPAASELGKFSLTDIFAAKTWKLNFKADNGKTGTLILPLPAQMVSFKVDIHDSDKRNNGSGSIKRESKFIIVAMQK
ncbi:MAG: hypothetical protein ACR2MG_18400 [Pyrinomonadaceae bacterium]